MHKVRVFAACAAAAISSPAFAVDVYQYDAPYHISPVWTDLYFGVHGAFSTANFDFGSIPNEKDKGRAGGVQLGYTWQGQSNFMFGFETDVSFGRLRDRVAGGNFVDEWNVINSFGSARARFGYSMGRLMPYVTGGLGWADATLGETCPPGAQYGRCLAVGPYNLQDSKVHFGWTAGAGAEFVISPSWSFKVEFLHADLGPQWYQFDEPASARTPTLKMDTVRVGLNFHF